MSLESWGKSPVPPKENPIDILEDKPIVYKLESGVEAELTLKEFLPKEPNKEKSDHSVIFLPGLAMNPGDKIMQGLGQAYAESSQSKTYVIKTELKQKDTAKEDYANLELFYQEAIAVSKFIKEKGFKEITLAGYSLGGQKAIDVACILQNNPELKINGLILLSSTGLYEQAPGEIWKKLVHDSLSTPGKVLKESKQYPDAFKRGAQGAINVVSNLIFKSEFRRNLKRESAEAEQFNERAAELKIPIVLISGTEDQVIEANKLLPYDATTTNLREQHLKDTIFNRSPYVRMITGKKLGKHGLPVFRAEEVANVSIHLLDRFYRDKKDTN